MRFPSANRMPFLLLCVCLLLISPLGQSAGHADDTPRGLLPGSPEPALQLPGSCQVFLQFDGLAGHKQAFSNSALGQLLEGELKELIKHFNKLLSDAIGPDQAAEQLLEGADPDELLVFQEAGEALPQVLEMISQDGFVMGAEFLAVLPPKFETTIVLPGAATAEKRKAVMALVKFVATENQLTIRTKEYQGREVLEVRYDEPGPFPRLWMFPEGQHLKLVVTTEAISTTMKRLPSGPGDVPGLASNPLFQEVTRDRGYETCGRAFIDLEGILSKVNTIFPPAQPFLDRLGLGGLKDLKMYVGFEDEYTRLTTVLRMPGPRQGALSLYRSSGSISLEDLPPLPPQSSSLGLAKLDLSTIYKEGLSLFEKLAPLSDGEDAFEEFQAGLKQFEQLSGVSITEELLPCLGDTVVTYSSQAEGFFGLGTVLGLEVQKPNKLAELIKRMILGLGRASGADISVDKRNYRGFDLYQVKISNFGGGFPFQPSYLITDQWVLASLYPQPLQSVILRSLPGDRYAQWQPSAKVARLLPQVSGEDRLTSLMVQDPRPALEFGMGLAPMIASAINVQAGSESQFDISLIPPTQAITEPLSESVLYVVDDGENITIESYSSLPIGIDASVIQFYSMMLPLAFRF